VRGHYSYYGITGNAEALRRFHYLVILVWRKWLSRRSAKATISWPSFAAVLQRYPLPPPRAVHSVYRGVVNP
jgi:hypothetical protein